MTENIQLMEHFGIQKNICPTYLYVAMGETGIVKYKPDSPEIVTENIVEFINGIKDNKKKVHRIFCII